MRNLHHLKSLLLLLLALCALPGMAQELTGLQADGYFPKALMRADGVARVLMYAHKQEDPRAVAGMGNAIRIAKEMTEETVFGLDGQVTAKRFYAPGEKVRDEVTFSYDAKGQLSAKAYQHYSPANLTLPDAPWVPRITSSTFYEYENGQLRRQATSMPGDAKVTQQTDYTYYPDGRLHTETVQNDRGNLVRTYAYQGLTTVVEERSGEVLQQVERITTDKSGRVLTHAYHPDGQATADLTEHYSYHPRGWLEEVRYEFDWTRHAREKVLLSRQNRYDDHGKLVEASLNYGDGRRTVQWYDYVYLVEGE